MKCSICLFETEQDQQLKCPCDSIICYDCMEQYTEFSLKENVLPKCTGCSQEYFKSDILVMKNPEIEKSYDMILFKKLSGEKIGKTFDKKKFIETVRKAKTTFITDTLPECISFIVKNALKDKLNKIDNKNKKFMKKQQNDSEQKPCLDPLCSGIVINEHCQKCNTVFCKDCERQKKENHACLQEDIDSVKFVESMIKCPSCKLPIMRSWGCNHMTCSSCNTNFDITTGKKIAQGNNHNEKIILKKQVQKLNVMYGQKYPIEIVKSLLIIDNLEPEQYDFKNVLAILLKCKNLEDDPEKNKKMSLLSIRYEKFKKTQKAYSEYLNTVRSIVDHESETSFDVKFLKNAIEILQK